MATGNSWNFFLHKLKFVVLLRRTCFAVRDRVRDRVRDQETILEQISNIVAVLNDYNICH